MTEILQSSNILPSAPELKINITPELNIITDAGSVGIFEWPNLYSGEGEPTGYNLIFNPNFEHDLLGLAPIWWIPGAYYPDESSRRSVINTFAITNEWSANGRQSLHVNMTVSGSSGVFALSSQPILITPNVPYHGSATIKINRIGETRVGLNGLFTTTISGGNYYGEGFNYTTEGVHVSQITFANLHEEPHYYYHNVVQIVNETLVPQTVDFYYDNIQLSKANIPYGDPDSNPSAWKWLGTPGNSISSYTGPIEGGVITPYLGNTVSGTLVRGADRYHSANIPLTLTVSGANVPSGTTVNYEWHLGDGTTASGNEVVHTYKTANLYTNVSVVATYSNGQQAVASKYVGLH